MTTPSMTFQRRCLIIVGCLALAGLPGGCGQSSDSSSPAPADPAPTDPAPTPPSDDTAAPAPPHDAPDDIVNEATRRELTRLGYTALHIEAAFGNRPGVERALAEGVNPNERIPSTGETALFIAVFDGHTEIIARLLEAGADPNLGDNSGEAPLHLAVGDQRADLVDLLLRSGAVVDRPGPFGMLPLHRAAVAADVEIVERLLEAGATIDPRVEGELLTPLHVAAIPAIGEKLPDAMQVATILLDARAEIDAEDSLGRQPIHWAAEYAEMPYFDLLLERGAAIDATSAAGLTMVHHFVVGRANREDMLRLLLSQGLDPDAEDDRGVRPVHLAAQAASLAYLDILIEHDAEHDPIGRDSMSVMHFAAHGRGVESEVTPRAAVIDRLIELGHAVDPRDSVNRTPLHLAAWTGEIEAVRRLLHHGAEADATTTEGFTPLHQACITGQTEVARILIEAGADVNAETTNGFTPLEIARLEGNAPLHELLESHGAVRPAPPGDDSQPINPPTGDHPGDHPGDPTGAGGSR